MNSGLSLDNVCGRTGPIRASLSSILVDEIKPILDRKQQHSDEQDHSCGLKWDHEFSGDTMTLSRKSRLVKDYGMLVTGGITFDASRLNEKEA